MCFSFKSHGKSLHNSFNALFTGNITDVINAGFYFWGLWLALTTSPPKHDGRHDELSSHTTLVMTFSAWNTGLTGHVNKHNLCLVFGA